MTAGDKIAIFVCPQHTHPVPYMINTSRLLLGSSILHDGSLFPHERHHFILEKNKTNCVLKNKKKEHGSTVNLFIV